MLNLLWEVADSYRFKQPITTLKPKRRLILSLKNPYKRIPMALREFCKCFKLDVSKEVMPYNVYT